jgi:hypothetical protein
MADKTQEQSQQLKPSSTAQPWSEQVARIRREAAAILAPPYPELENDNSIQLGIDPEVVEAVAKVEGSQ